MRLYQAGLAQAAGDVELQAGDPAAAERIFRGSLDILREVGNSALVAVSELLLASSLYAQGRYEEAAELVGAAEQGSEGWTRMLRRSLEARLAARAGDFELAVELAREADGLAASIDSPVMQADAAVAQAEVYRLAGRAREAEQALARAIDLHESKGSTAGARLARQPA
jgi:tetratricopeptide (TPR) repeat protein